MRQAPGQSCPRRDNACPGADPCGESAATILSLEPGGLSLEELSAVVLAAEWSLAGSWAELTSEDEEARLQSGVVKLRARVDRLKKGRGETR